MKKRLQLTQEQKDLIDSKGIDITDLSALTREVFGDEKLDGRTKQGRAVREYLAEKEIAYQTKHIDKKEDVELTEEQKEFIMNNSSSSVSSLELAKLVFSDQSIKNMSKEFWAVHDL